MSKKKNKKNQKNKGKKGKLHYYNGGSFESSRDKKKGKKNRFHEEPKLKRVKLSLGKREVKENREIALEPYKIPKKLLENRMNCNHANGTLSVQDFLDAGFNPAISPMLDATIAMFGEENVTICAACYDVVVAPEAVTSDKVKAAVTLLYAAINKALSRKRLGGKTVRSLSKTRTELVEYSKLISMLRKIEKDDAKYEAGSSNVDGVSLSDLNDL